MNVAVVGHVEWIDFVRVARVPRQGEIIHGWGSWADPAGGGAVAAVQIARLAGASTLYTALGNDELGKRSADGLRALGVRVACAERDEPQRRGVTFVDDDGERTITVVGDRLAPSARDPIDWGDLADTDAVYITAADPEAIRLARRSRVVVATSRILPDLRAAGIRLDALVGSALDPSERYQRGDLDPVPSLVVRTAGAKGGTYETPDGTVSPFAPSKLPGPIVDSYGCGDSFAGGLTYALGAGMSAKEALRIAAACGAWVLTGRGPYTSQPTLEQIVSPAPDAGA